MISQSVQHLNYAMVWNATDSEQWYQVPPV